MLSSSFKKDVNDLAVKASLEYIRTDSKYTLDKFFKENDLLKGSVTQGNNTKIPCPFHEDSDPSLSADLDKNIYKCFSCGRGGGYINFVLEYNKIVLGRELTFYKLLEEMLREDLAMRTTIGYTTIFRKAKVITREEKFKMFKPDMTLVENGPQTYIELANRMKRRKDLKKDDIVLMISLMQQGISPTEIYNQIFNTELKSMVEGFSIDEIIGG